MAMASVGRSRGPSLERHRHLNGSCCLCRVHWHARNSSRCADPLRRTPLYRRRTSWSNSAVVLEGFDRGLPVSPAAEACRDPLAARYRGWSAARADDPRPRGSAGPAPLPRLPGVPRASDIGRQPTQGALIATARKLLVTLDAMLTTGTDDDLATAARLQFQRTRRSSAPSEFQSGQKPDSFSDPSARFSIDRSSNAMFHLLACAQPRRTEHH